jgi:hypothetical protein
MPGLSLHIFGNRLKRNRHFVVILGIVIFAATGAAILYSSHASTPTASVEPESGTLAASSCQVKVTDATASGGKALKYASCPPPVAGCSATQPSGSGISQYQALAGAAFGPRVDSAPAGNTVSLAPGTFTFRDFAYTAGGSQTGAVISTAGLIGSGVDTTTVEMVANSSTKASLVPTANGQTNQLSYMVITKAGMKLSCMTILGTAQGHFYNGIRVNAVSNVTMSHLKLVGIGPGNSNFPPGETFAINDYKGNANIYDNVEIDGAGTGASAFGANSSSNTVYTNDYAHGSPYNAGMALWQMTGTVTVKNFRTINNRIGISFERVNATVNLTNVTFGTIKAQDMFIGNDQGSAKINIYDPVLLSRTKLTIDVPKLEQGNPDKQLTSDIHVYVKGVDKTSTLVQFSS